MARKPKQPEDLIVDDFIEDFKEIIETKEIRERLIIQLEKVNIDVKENKLKEQGRSSTRCSLERERLCECSEILSLEAYLRNAKSNDIDDVIFKINEHLLNIRFLLKG